MSKKSLRVSLLLVIAMSGASGAEPKGQSTLVRASEAGAALNTDPMTGGGTDDTAVLQRALDRAKTGRGAHLLIDGPALVGGLDLHSNTILECTAGGGLYLKDDASRAILRNAHRSRAAVTDERLTVRGCFLNGNRARQRLDPAQKAPYRESDGSWASGVQFLGVRHLTLENLTLWNVRSYNVWIANAKYLHLSNITVDNGVAYPDGASLAEQRAYQQQGAQDDGVHLNGPIQYATIDGLKLYTVDDALALNANDHIKDDITAENLMGPYVGQGPITDVAISNVVLMDAHQGIRLLSRDQRIDRITINNVIGTVRQRVVLLSHFINTQHVGNFGSIAFSNIAVDPVVAPTYLELYPEILEYTSKNPSAWDVAEEAERPLFSLNSPIENLSLSNIVTKVIDKRPIIRIGKDARVQTLNVDLSLYDPAKQAVPVKLMGRVERFNFLLNWQGEAPIRKDGGAIGNLNMILQADIASPLR